MKQADYWKNRFTQLEEAQNQKALDYYSTLEDEFSRAARNVDKELAAWYTRFAKNEGITFAEAKQVLTKGELSAFKMSVDDYIKKGKTLPYSDQWTKELERASAKFHVTRLEALQLQMQQQIEVMYGYELDTFDQFIANQYKAGYYKTMFEFQKGFGVGFDVMKLDDNKIAKLISKPWAPDGQNFSSRIWRDKNKLMTEMPSILTQATIRGDGYAKTSKLLAERFNVSKSQAKNLVITESAFFSSVSQRDSFSNLGVEKYEIVATLDSKTSSICRDMNQRVFDLKDFEPGVTASPFHGRCRTFQSPSFDDDFGVPEMRAARDENGKTITVPASMTYREWEKKFVK
ncbi:minor capsid protein [Acetobacterium wieringae]|uniref:minor capsid protein n=1 Tax=Acetobacterium wieringae TaxID=52694 RepID=UPI0020338E93|nr:minor capsid protein [Acetobacterium wieringae]URN83982.1 minor capsid protein [Acetobacterium wieringae]